MLDLAIMIEGQNGLNWQRWKKIGIAVEQLGFAGLFRSDHFLNSTPPDKDSLECWISLAWLACHTERIQFGPLVSPLSFRHPTIIARMAAGLDDLSNGRLVLGLGAGWQEREHTNFGFDLLDPKSRFDRLEEGLIIITRLLQSDAPVTFTGNYYHTQEAVLLPRPARPGGPSILVGGNGPTRTPRLAAKHASEWNAVYLTADRFRQRSARVDEAAMAAGRKPDQIRRSMMTGCVIGKDERDVERRIEMRTQGKRSLSELRQHGVIAGTATEIIDQLAVLQEAGVERVMLQWLELDDLEGLELLARDVLPHFRGKR